MDVNYFYSFKSYSQFTDTVLGNTSEVTLDFLLFNNAIYFKCMPNVTIFSLLSQIGGILGLSKIFVLAFLYNERSFEKNLAKEFKKGKPRQQTIEVGSYKNINDSGIQGTRESHLLTTTHDID